MSKNDPKGGFPLPNKYLIPIAILVGFLALAVAFGLDRDTNRVMDREAARACGGEENVAEVTVTGYTCTGEGGAE